MWWESLNQTSPSRNSETSQRNPSQSGPPCCIPQRVACFEDSWFGISKFLDNLDVGGGGKARPKESREFSSLPDPRDEQGLYDKKKNIYNFFLSLQPCRRIDNHARPRRQTQDTSEEPYTWTDKNASIWFSASWRRRSTTCQVICLKNFVQLRLQIVK